MDIDAQHVIELLKKRQEIDNELANIFAGMNSNTGKKTITCSICKEPGHTARSCEKRDAI